MAVLAIGCRLYAPSANAKFIMRFCYVMSAGREQDRIISKLETTCEQYLCIVWFCVRTAYLCST